ncbi:MAG TPA: SDR family oxidoreductase [Actinomycetota bacterium]|nr:SDR family oxidoreductase [Actinomycetota bacterium]
MGALDGRVVVVTGASRGLGESLAIGYAQARAHVVLSARSKGDLDRVAEACRDAGAASATVVPADVTDEAAVQSLVDATVAQHGTLDCFVANAGTSFAMLTDKRYRELATWDAGIAEEILRVNVVGVLSCLKAAIPAMTAGGSFIAIGSETGRALRPGSGMYAVSKAALDALATMAARETAETGIRVNVLSPGGMVDTQLFGPNGMPDFLKQMHPPLPPDVIVPAAIWLASDDSDGVTGRFVSAKTFNEMGPAAAEAAR